MKKLLLFDIDGTLQIGKAQDSHAMTIKKVYGFIVSSNKNFNGFTDYLILVDLLLDYGLSLYKINSSMPMLLTELDRIHNETFHIEDMVLLPGVEELLNDLVVQKKVVGLVTDNLEPIALRKLNALGIGRYFTVGAFGSDLHITRSDLVSIAITAGVRNSIGVATGSYSVEELKSAGAKAVLRSFNETEEVTSALSS